MTTDKHEEQILKVADDLPTEVMPEKDLWPGIAAAIEQQDQAGTNHGWPRWAAQAAAVLLLVGASSGMTWIMLQDGAGSDPAMVDNGELTFQPVSGSFGSQYSLGPDFQDARSTLASKLDEELERLPPATRAEVEKNMATIRAAISEINKALANDPDNALLQELLISSYSEELAIMRKVDVIATAAMRRTDI